MKKLWIMLMATMCVGMAQAQTWEYIVSGGDLEDENTCIEVQCNTEGYVVEKGYPAPVAGAGMEGTKGIAVFCPASSTQSWDPQMWIVFNEAIMPGERIYITFDYKASMPINVPTNFQDANTYLYDTKGIGVLEFSEEWQNFAANMTIPYDDSWSANSVSRICLLLGNMNMSRTEDVTIYIDNVSVKKYKWENAEVTGECGVGLKWSFNHSTGVLTIDGEGAMRDDYKYGINDDEEYFSTAPWFAYNNEIRSIRVNEGVTSIGNYAFMALPKLENVKLPNTLTTLGGYAFFGCESLRNIKLPDSLTKLGVGTFRQSGLTYVEVPDQITSIPNYCFYVCGSLQSITLPSNLTRIGDKAFDQCKMMQYISLPAGLETIGNSAFSLTGLKSIVIPKIVQGIGEAAFYQSKLESVTFEGYPEQIGQQVFARCENLTEVILPDGFTTIPYAGFMMCTSLKSITIPASVTTIESRAFSDCPLETVKCLGTVPPTANYDSFDMDQATFTVSANLLVPKGSKEAYSNEVPWGFFQNRVEYENTVPTEPTDQEADCAFYISPTTIKAGEEVAVELKLKNALTVVGFNVTVDLPEGLSFVYLGSNPKYEVNNSRFTTGTDEFFYVNAQSKRSVTLMFYHTTTDPRQMVDNDGTVVTLYLKADSNLAPGEYGVSLNTMNAYTREEGNKEIADCTANITCEKGWECTHIQGDVNGDGKVTIADVNRLIEILKKLKIEGCE